MLQARGILLALFLTALPAVMAQTTDRVQGILGTLRTGQTTVYAEFDDAWYAQRGNGVTRSFSEPVFNVVEDDNTGLQWIKDPSRIGPPYGTPGDPTGMMWADANTAANNLFWGTDNDWRLPSVIELLTLTNYGAPETRPRVSGFNYSGFFDQPFLNSYTGETFFTSDVPAEDLGGTKRWAVEFSGELRDAQEEALLSVRPVRTSVSQTAPRFSLSDGRLTVTDQVSGLMWVADPSDAGLELNYDVWMAAIYACEDLNYAGHEDWRLPNINELLSIADFSKADPMVDENFFTIPTDAGGTNKQYWTSTTRPTSSEDDVVWVVRFRNQGPRSVLKSSGDAAVRPVRNTVQSSAAAWRGY